MGPNLRLHLLSCSFLFCLLFLKKLLSHDPSKITCTNTSNIVVMSIDIVHFGQKHESLVLCYHVIRHKQKSPPFFFPLIFSKMFSCWYCFLFLIIALTYFTECAVCNTITQLIHILFKTTNYWHIINLNTILRIDHRKQFSRFKF